MIPKIIHYCWFGGNKKPKLAKKCIKSWKKYCPDYKIVEWNESNVDISKMPLYVRQAYENKKWAFVSDYVRLYALINLGGIYMDTDVEVIKTFDPFLRLTAFLGYESEKFISTGIMASIKNNAMFKEFLQEYDSLIFIKKDGSYDLTTNVQRITNTCLKYGLKQNNTKQTVNNLTIFPLDYFSPMVGETKKLTKTKNTVTIHHFSASWWGKKEKESFKRYKRNKRKAKYKNYIKKMIRSLFGEKLYNKIKNMFK